MGAPARTARGGAGDAAGAVDALASGSTSSLRYARATAPDPALADRAARFALHREATIPPQLASGRPFAADLALIEALLLRGVDDAPDAPGLLVLLPCIPLPATPPVLADPATGAWRCAAGLAEGAGALELLCWLRDCPLLGAACWLRAARRTDRQRPSGPRRAA